jgi:hypothetical protein
MSGKRTSGTFAHVAAVAGVALALAGIGAAPWAADHADAAKQKKNYPNVAVQTITLEPHADAGHKTVVVAVANIGKRDANGFRIGMSAQRADGTVRTEVFSLPLSVAKGAATEVEFRLGCGWIDGGAITARTDPSPVPGEPANKTANNVETASFGDECQ